MIYGEGGEVSWMSKDLSMFLKIGWVKDGKDCYRVGIVE